MERDIKREMGKRKRNIGKEFEKNRETERNN